MNIRCFGDSGRPAVLLIPECGMLAETLTEPLDALQKKYFLLAAEWNSETGTEGTARELAHWLQTHHSGRVWGAYGLRTGGELLLQLLAEPGISVRTAVVEGCRALPPALKHYEGTLYCWKGARDRKAGSVCEELRSICPTLKTLTFKKKKAADSFAAIRPDLMTTRLIRVFGKAQTICISGVIEKNADSLWREVHRRPDSRELRHLKDAAPVRYEDDTMTRIIEGSDGKKALWSHRTQLQTVDDGSCICTDRAEVTAGPLTPAVRFLAKGYLLQQQRKLARRSGARRSPVK